MVFYFAYSCLNDRQNSLSSRKLSAFPPVHLWCRCLITHIEQHFDFVIRHTAIQCNGNPTVLPHMIGWKKAGFFSQGANEDRVAFEIDHIQ